MECIIKLQKKNLQKIIDYFKKSFFITVFTGAGISTNCGIPDFRGPEGLYSMVEEKYELPFPEAIFEIEYFQKNPVPFYDFSKELLLSGIEPSLTHNFIHWLEKKDKISSIVTQNIDMLHEKTGTQKIVACHGTYNTAHCLSCYNKYKFEEFEDSLRAGTVQTCNCGGIIKPDVVFFGENLPSSFFQLLYNLPQTDLLLVMGTSLNVQPAASFPLNIIRDLKPFSIFVNKEATIYDDLFTYVINEDVDEFSQIIWENLSD